MEVFTSNYSGGYGNKYEFKTEAREEKESDYIQTNQTTVIVDIYTRRTDSSSNGAYNLNGTPWNITIDGTGYSGTSTWDTRNTTAWQYLGTASKVITHDSDGRKIITISASHTGNSASGSSKMGDASGSGTFILTTIPRTSSISGGSGNIGSTSEISITRASSSFTHTLRYVFGSLSGTIATGVATSCIWTIPTSFYEQIPNAKNGTGTIYCDTYSTETLVGTKSISFTASTSESACKPTISATVVDTNSATIALTGDSNKLIKYKSTAKVTATTTAKNSATINKTTINGTTISNNTISYSNVSASSFKIVTTDSRGYTAETTKTPTMVNYVPLTINANFFRPQPTTGEVSLTYSGNYFSGNFGAISNTLSMTWKYKVQGASSWTTGGTITPTISDSTISQKTISLGTNFDYQTAYDFQLTAVDKLTTATTTATVSVGMPVFYWGKDFFNVNTNIAAPSFGGYKLSTINTANTTGTWVLVTNGSNVEHGIRKIISAKTHTDYPNNQSYFATMSCLSYWNGAYNSGNSSNLTYCYQGTIQAKPKSLYSNTSGTTGTVTLSETAANFSYLEIFLYKNDDSGWWSVKVPSPNGKNVQIGTNYFASSAVVTQTASKTVTISGTSIKQNVEKYINFSMTSGTTSGYGDNSSIKIMKVVGYK